MFTVLCLYLVNDYSSSIISLCLDEILFGRRRDYELGKARVSSSVRCLSLVIAGPNTQLKIY